VLWVERTADDFTFNVKAFRLFTTHQTQPTALPRGVREELPSELTEKRNLYYKDLPLELRNGLWQMFGRALSLLAQAGKLGVLVFQFPPWVMPRQDSYRHLEECKEHLRDFPIAVEFRSRNWLEETLGFLRSHHISYIAVDEPQGFKSSVPPVADVTDDYAVVRFHDRNREIWEKRGLASAAERFNYYYSRDELAEWASKVALLSDNAREVHLVMNTNNQDQGIVSARLLSQVLGEQFGIERAGLR